MPNEDRLALRADEAAAMLSIGRTLLWSMTASGRIPHVRIGRSVRYPVGLLQRWLDEQGTKNYRNKLSGRGSEN